jgi:spermidine synthase
VPARRAFALLYLCSGAAGLVYEIVWTRLLSLHLGHSVAAVGTVLAAFMGGLAAGAVIAGALAPRLPRERALRFYAAIECAIAACAVAVPSALQAFKPLLTLAYGDEPGPTFALVRFSLCLLLVFVPAAAIGATFPLAIRWFVGEAATAGRDAGRLYALNTVGAATGAFVTGFALIPAIGLRGTTWVGVALNLSVAAGAWLLADRTPVAASRAAPPKKPAVARRDAGRRVGETNPQTWPRWLPAAVLGIAGFVALVYEVAFTRVLAIALGPTTYAFAAMLTAFIAGLAIGAAIASRRAAIGTRAAFSIGLLMLVVAATGAGAGWFAGTRLPLLVAEAVADRSAGPSAILAREAIYGVGVLLPLSAALGALFPLAVSLAVGSNDRVARDASVVYGVNTAGAVAGSLAGAFVLIPFLGLQITLRVAGLVAVGAACLTFLLIRLASSRQRVTALAAAIAVGALLLMVPPWDLNLLSGGGYKYASEVRDLDLDLETGLKAGTLLYYKEGAAATVSVRRLAGRLALAIDGKVDASNGPDMLTQKLLAHLPLLLHSNPRRIAVIGLGSGVTVGAALAHGIERADVLEISPEVVEASSLFADDNGRALQDPRVRLLVSDGRTHLQLTSQLYDVIISEPSNPWMAGVASLFTREFFEAARARLAPGGVICQWAHTYDIADADLRSIAATFVSVFPNGTMWLIGDSDLLFIATNDSTGPRIQNAAGGWRPGVAADLAEASVFDPFSLFSLYVAGPAELQRYGQGAFIQTDDRMTLEFSAPLGVYLQRKNDNAGSLQALLDPARAPVAVHDAMREAGAPEWRNRGQMLLKAQAYSPAYDSFSRSLQIDPDDEETLAGLVDAAGAGERLMDAQHLLESLAAGSPGRLTIRSALARLLAAMGEYEQATAHAQRVIAADPDNPRGPELLASILADAGDVARLGPLVARMQQRHPDREETSYYAAMLSFLTGNFPEAIARAERVLEVSPRHALALNLIGSANANLGRRDLAREAFRASLEASPQDPSTYANLGMIEMESGNRDAAITYFAESLTLDPRHEAARTHLSAALATAEQRP